MLVELEIDELELETSLEELAFGVELTTLEDCDELLEDELSTDDASLEVLESEESPPEELTEDDESELDD